MLTFYTRNSNFKRRVFQGKKWNNTIIMKQIYLWMHLQQLKNIAPNSTEEGT